jgi:hypothetical protein
MRRTLLVLAGVLLLGCGNEAPQPLVDEAGVGSLDAMLTENDAKFDVTQEARPADCRVAASDGTICTCTEVGQRPPTLYLLLDRSGSMADPAPGSTRSKWSLVRSALLDSKSGALRRLGGRLSVAVAWFPSPSSTDECNAGKQVFGPVRGSPAVYDELEAKLQSALPRGATPTAASLRAVEATLGSVPQPAYVLLATDGAPNCGAGPCTGEACTYNIEGSVTFSGKCDAALNCCDPAKNSQGLGWKGCVDIAPTKQAAADIAAAGHKVFVLGVPGLNEAYARALDEIAIAGGAPRDGSPKYYAASAPTQDALTEALSAIAGQVVDTCNIRLDAPVADPGITNVLLDGEPVTDWKWTSDSSIELTGAACDRIHAGKVASVQVVIGCKTVTK